VSADPFTLCAVLDLVTGENRPWSIAELARVTDDSIGTTAAADELEAAGIVERSGDDAICVTRAGVYASVAGGRKVA
jgi:hypothetical protein